MKILKFGEGLDTGNVVKRMLGPGFDIIEYDPRRPAIDQVRDVDVLLLRDEPVPAAIIDAAPKLKLLQRFGMHFMGVDIKHALSKGIYVARVPSDQTGSTRVVAEHTMFLMLALAKRYKQAVTCIAEQRTGVPKTVAMFGKTLGMIGIGKTGEALAPLAAAFGMKVIGVKRSADPKLARELGMDFLGDMSSMERILRESDFLSIHLPLEPETTGFFGRRELSLMKKGAFFINIARGPIVVKEALHEALVSGHLGGAALDVFWEEPIDPKDPLLALDNVIATPHHAGATFEAQENLAAMVADNVRRVAAGEPPINQVGAEGH
jgi:phosphoglycerate dehydrogenase-like enzyme